MNSDQKNYCTFHSSTLKVEENKVSFFGSDVIWWRYDLFYFFDLRKVFRYLHEITKSQIAYISLKWCQIQKIKTRYFLHLQKLNKEKCTYFHDQSLSWWVMVILWFHENTRKSLRRHKMKKNSYLPQMTSIPKNKGTLFSSTLKVEKGKVHVFSWSEFILGSYSNFVIS